VDIVSSQSPDKRIDPNTDEGRTKVQAVVDALADVFVSAVSDFRKSTPEKVLSDLRASALQLQVAL
jgi:ClpP class serine protease